VFRVAACLVVIATLSGCGGGQSDSSEVTSVTRSYLAAVASGNGSKACSLLSDSARRRLPSALHMASSSCPEAVDSLYAVLSEDVRAQLHHPVLAVPRIAGRSASVRSVVGSNVSDVPLSKTSAGWRVNAVLRLTVSTVSGASRFGANPVLR
jgi:hypothetical protein